MLHLIGHLEFLRVRRIIHLSVLVIVDEEMIDELLEALKLSKAVKFSPESL